MLSILKEGSSARIVGGGAVDGVAQRAAAMTLFEFDHQKSHSKSVMDHVTTFASFKYLVWLSNVHQCW